MIWSLLLYISLYIVSDVYDLFDAKFLTWNTVPKYSNPTTGKWYLVYKNPLWYEVLGIQLQNEATVSFFTRGKIFVYFLKMKMIILNSGTK